VIRDSEFIAPAAVSTHTEPNALPGVIELESGSLRVRFSGPIDAAALRLVLGQLGRRA